MTSTSFTRRVSHIMIALAFVFVILPPRSARAQTPSEVQCFNQLTSCYFWAAVQSSFWYVWASGLDCELQFVNCVRTALLGR